MLSQYALLTIMSDNESSDEEWYARMEAEGAKNDDNIHAVSITNSQENEPAAAELSDDAYFTMIETHGSTLVDGSFRSESDIVWQSMLRSAVRGKVNETKIDELRELNQNDFSSVSMCQQWLFGFLPKSSKQFMDLDLFMNYLDDNHKLYTDDAAHPSIVVSIWTKYGGNRIEVSLFSPFSVQELRSVVPLLFNTLDKVRQISGLEDVMFCGLDVMLYESSIAINKNNLEEQWVENCGMLICESSHTQKKTFESSSCEDDKYFIDTLCDEDADLINDTWKYKTAASLDLVKRMIKIGLCRGVRFVGHDSGTHLVAWFQTYPDGSCGMLYTLPEHRGKGLARRVVRAVLEVLGLDASRKCAPFVYIERSNAASLALFSSLGFVKCNDVVWAGLRYDAMLF